MVMARKRTRISERMLFTWFVLAGFILLLAPDALTNKFQFAFARLFRYPLSVGRNLPLSVQTQLSTGGDAERRQIQYQNYITNLEEEIRQKQQEIEKLSGLRQRLHALSGAKLIPADIITGATEGQRCELVINRGSDDGLAKGQFVLGDNSVIGAVSDVSARTATVRTITDSSFVIPVRIKGLDVDMVMQGGGSGIAKIKLVPARYKIASGDTVIANKKPGLLDAPMVIGVVKECRRHDDNATLWDITVRPACETGKLAGVAVIVMNPATNDKR